MKPYLITVRMPDGSGGRFSGIFATDWDAIDAALKIFATACLVTARRLACAG